MAYTDSPSQIISRAIFVLFLFHGELLGLLHEEEFLVAVRAVYPVPLGTGRDSVAVGRGRGSTVLLVCNIRELRLNNRTKIM